MTDISSIRRAILAKDIAALKAECLAFDAGLRAARLALWLRYDPDQPRVPAGSADGGQWTSGGGGGVTGAPDPSGGSAGDDASAAEGEWRTISQGVTADGTRTETVARDDGTIIRSEYAASRAAGFDERHIVATPDGGLRSFETEGLRQTVRDELGEVLSRSEFRPDGAVLEPAAAQVIVPPLVQAARVTYGAAVALYAWMSTQNSPQQQAILSFSARDFSSPQDLTRVDTLSRSELASVCPAYPTVQSLTNQAAWDTDRAGLTPQQYGTEVHTRLKALVSSFEGLRGEVSLMKSTAASYGQPGSIRIDVLENRGDGTLCVYDIKTGERGLSLPRTVEIAGYAFSNTRMFGRPPARIIVTEVRPFE